MNLSPKQTGFPSALRVVFPLLLIFFYGVYFFLLPVVQSFIIPQNGGIDGPWVVQPIFSYRFGAAAILTIVTVPVMASFLRKKGGMGPHSVADPHDGRPIRTFRVYVAGILSFVVSAAALVFYLLSWHVIGPKTIEVHLPWIINEYSYQDIRSLKEIPLGMRSESILQDGPWHEIEFHNGQTISLSLDNERLSATALANIAKHVAEQSGKQWTARKDARRP